MRTLFLPWIALGVVTAPAILPAQAFSPSAPALVAAPATVILRPGDAIRITVWRKPELSGEFVVAADSSVIHPLYRAVKVAGVPLAMSEARVRAFLDGLEANPSFVLEPLLRVTVGGEVARPNLYTLRPETSISQAVALAGGPTERGQRDRVRVLRGDTVVVLDLTRAGVHQSQMPIRSGDQILIERRRSVFKDFIAPSLTLVGATAAILNVVLRSR
jgi:protein involved in polysaccharide export with SLBB domain